MPAPASQYDILAVSVTVSLACALGVLLLAMLPRPRRPGQLPWARWARRVPLRHAAVLAVLRDDHLARPGGPGLAGREIRRRAGTRCAWAVLRRMGECGWAERARHPGITPWHMDRSGWRLTEEGWRGTARVDGPHLPGEVEMLQEELWAARLAAGRHRGPDLPDWHPSGPSAVSRPGRRALSGPARLDLRQEGRLASVPKSPRGTAPFTAEACLPGHGPPPPAGGLLRAFNSAPATIVSVLGAISALIIAFGHLTPAQSAMVMSLAGAVGTLAVVIAGVIAGKPVSLQLVTGAVTVLAADLALFGIRTNPDQRAALAGAVAVVLGVVLHLLHVTMAQAPLSQAAVSGGLPPVPHRPSGTGEI